MPVKSLNEVFSSLSVRRRYEVWFVRLGLADGSGAWWFRYLLLNPGRSGCPGNSRGMPVQVWATWFPREAKPQSFIQGFSLAGLDLSARGQTPFHFRSNDCQIGENSCRGELIVDGHRIAWDLGFRSSFRVTLSDKGWIGFSRSPHSDAVFSGWISLDGCRFNGDPLGFGVQGHNCGYRHRSFWAWAHAYFPRTAAPASTLEALVYDMPFGLVFRKAVLRHGGVAHVFRNLQEITKDSSELRWNFCASSRDGLRLDASFEGEGLGIHRLPYVKTDCSGKFEVANNSLAKAAVRLRLQDGPEVLLETQTGAVLEMAGR
ncbi:MAG TPA: hypothetical protein VLW84_11815 [Terriglobales bacterium]|nr:hypothetical protein [Terriglobales bacterium]